MKAIGNFPFFVFRYLGIILEKGPSVFSIPSNIPCELCFVIYNFDEQLDLPFKVLEKNITTNNLAFFGSLLLSVIQPTYFNTRPQFVGLTDFFRSYLTQCHTRLYVGLSWITVLRASTHYFMFSTTHFSYLRNVSQSGPLFSAFRNVFRQFCHLTTSGSFSYLRIVNNIAQS